MASIGRQNRKVDIFLTAIFVLSALIVASGAYCLSQASGLKSMEASLSSGKTKLVEIRKIVDSIVKEKKDNPSKYLKDSVKELDMDAIYAKLLNIVEKNGSARWDKFDPGKATKKVGKYDETGITIKFTKTNRSDVFDFLGQVEKDSTIPFKTKELFLEFTESMDIQSCQIDLASYRKKED